MDPGSQAKAVSIDVDFVALAVGQMVGRYEIVATLGQGSFGITYRARDTRLGRDVALKEYLPSALAIRHEGATVLPRSTQMSSDFAWGRDRFVAEGQTLASLQNAPAIVRVFDFLEANGTAYIVMQLLSGETLEAHLQRKGCLTPGEVDRILWPLLDGLEQVHNAGFLHRDIKPANVLLDAEGNAALIDFGASRAAMAGRTVAMTAIFTPGYAAAEQFTSTKQGPWTDIYGVAATLYQAIIGKVPPNAFDRMVEDEYAPLAILRPAGFALGLLQGLDAAMAVKAGDRPQSIVVWRELLKQIVWAGNAATVLLPRLAPPATAASPVSPTPEATPATSARKAAVWIAAAAVASLVMAGGAYLLFTPPTKTPTALSVADATAERNRIDRQVQSARAALAVAEQAAQRQSDEDFRLAAETEKRKAETDATAKLQAAEDARRQTAQQSAQQQADAEAAKKKADADAAAKQNAEDEEARRKADAQAAEHQRIQQEVQNARNALAVAEAARRQAEEDTARFKAEAEAITRRQTDAETKQKTDAEVASKQEADAEAAARQKDLDGDKKRAEAVETALRLSQIDRQRVQVVLTSLGFDTRGSDGAFGPRSREMIAAWQKSGSRPSTGFLDGAQHQALLREAARTLQKYDDEQKKIEEEKKKAEEARAKVAAAVPSSPAPPAQPTQPADDNKILEQKIVAVYKKSGPANCDTNFNYTIRVYRNMIQVHLGGAWRTARADAQGRLDSGEFRHDTSGSMLRITGTLSPRVINVESLTSLCGWQAAF